MAHPQPQTAPSWWRSAVIYQVYPSSFADGNGDGIGDLAGLRQRLPYLRDLGVDAIWLTPWFVSPHADGGYDVADYRVIDPAFGTIEEAEDLIAEALAFGIRTIIDIVPNHVSDQHAWFLEALAAGSGSPARERFWFREGNGTNGDDMPTTWISSFQGDTWTRTTNADGSPGEWYLHLFTPQQPDLNWSHPDVRAEFEDVIAFWLDRGVGGIRIDSAALLVKDDSLPEVPDHAGPGHHPYIDRDELHEIYRSWRALADSYQGTRILVGEVWLDDPSRFSLYLRPDEMHTAFNFDFMARPWQAKELRDSIDTTLAAHGLVGAPATWVLSNHDVTRPVTRYGRENSSFAFAAKRFGTPTNLERGTQRARAAALLTAALPGSLYVYQGDELGLPEVEDLPLDVLRDPMHDRSGGVDPGRDGCRVPLPWSGDSAPFGFSLNGATGQTWLPQPQSWADYSVVRQASDSGSMLNLYRDVLARRRTETSLGDGPLTWLETEDDVLAFARGDVICVVNLSDESVALPPHSAVLVSSQQLLAGQLPRDAAAWLRASTDPNH